MPSGCHTVVIMPETSPWIAIVDDDPSVLKALQRTLRVRALPNFWNHSSCDHGVSTRLLPAGPQQTAIRVYWLVDEKAVEGRDYDLAKLTPFWQLTSEQDWQICERQQRGVNSSVYAPGPYSAFKEYNVASFVKWYLNSLQRDA